jgi:CheY-like chemotaxis protein
LRVLVVDDNHNAALAMAAYLSLENIDSRAVFGGHDAIDLAPEWAPHIILMDIWMPGCNGIEAARVLRRDPRTDGIAIVAHTALDETEVRRQLKEDEFDGYLQKGRDLSQLIQLLKTFTRDAGA